MRNSASPVQNEFKLVDEVGAYEGAGEIGGSPY